MKNRINDRDEVKTIAKTVKGGTYRNIPLKTGIELPTIAYDGEKKVAKCYLTVAQIKEAFPGAWPKAYMWMADTDKKEIRIKEVE